MVYVPLTYSHVYESELIKHGFKIVIYANQMMRSLYPDMSEIAKKILSDKRTSKIEKKITFIKDIFTLIQK